MTTATESPYVLLEGDRIPRKVCPVGGCSEPVRADFIMCRGHWARVDREAKVANSRAFRAWKKTPDSLETIRALRASIAECVRSAEENAR